MDLFIKMFNKSEYINLNECSLSIQEGVRRVLQTFQKILCSPGDHRAKYFMAQ